MEGSALDNYSVPILAHAVMSFVDSFSFVFSSESHDSNFVAVLTMKSDFEVFHDSCLEKFVCLGEV